jgi:EAL domain-containing protein (putative c-di-GMP-specific phosphodiesterase class I)
VSERNVAAQGRGASARPEDEFAHLRISYLRLKSALRDPSTGLYGFTLLFDEIRRLLDERGELGVITVEMANLALVESVYGWQALDRVRQRVSVVLEMGLGRDLSPETRVAINGVHGDAFLLFVPETLEGERLRPEALAATAASVDRALSSAFCEAEYASMAPPVRFQVGCALLAHNPFYRFERLVYQAIAEARRSGERADDRQRLAWTAELKRILSERCVHSLYQPVVSLDDRSVLGFEALARGPSDSVFEMPRVMFAFSEQIGMETELDRVCRTAALAGANAVPEGACLFVNTLPESLSDPEWISEPLAEHLDSAGLPRSSVIIEVSDRATHERLTQLAPEVSRLREAGFRIALDNVGTGYASLEAIAELQPDFLKVDPSLVQDLERNALKQELVRSLARLAEKVGATLVAGGIESDPQMQAARRCGARYGQGRLLAEATGSASLPGVDS